MPLTESDSPQQNRILAALSAAEYARLADDFELVSLKIGQVLYEPGDSVDYVHFPTSCIVSRMSITESGASAELAMTGNDGLIGTALVLGGDTTTYRVVVQSAGTAYRVRGEVMRWEIDQGGNLQRLVLRYIQSLMTQMAQSVVCNRHHSVEQQLCRLLLLMLDRTPGSQLDMTQERIANMLGVRREGVTEAAGKLQAAGLIHYSRGHIAILDRPGLEARVCECYAAVKQESDRLARPSPALRVSARERPNPATLRRRAEARLQTIPPVVADAALDSTRLLHELQVHQIELEMQHEALQTAYAEADALRERYADIYDFAPIAYLTLDPLGAIVDLNLAGATLLGITRSQKTRHRFAASVAPEYVDAFNRYLADVLTTKGKNVCEIALLPADHHGELTVRIEAVPDESGRECRMVLIDITAERLAEKALFQREQYQRALLDNFPFMVWLKDEQSRFLAANTALAREFGLPSPEALVGKTDFDIAARERAEAYRAEDSAVLKSGETTLVEQFIENDGQGRWLEVYKSPIRIGDQLAGTVGFARDITEQKRLQAELQSLESTDLLTRLANRRHFLERMEEALSRVQRAADDQTALLVVDLEHFAEINTILGHAAGDAMLRTFSGFLREQLRKADVGGRIDDHEFAVLLPGTDPETAAIFAERLRREAAGLSAPMQNRKISFALNIGVSTMSTADKSAEEVLARACEALQRTGAGRRKRIAGAAGAGGETPGIAPAAARKTGRGARPGSKGLRTKQVAQ